MKKNIARTASESARLKAAQYATRTEKESLLRDRLQTYIKSIIRLQMKIEILHQKDGRSYWREIKDLKDKLKTAENMYDITVFELRCL